MKTNSGTIEEWLANRPNWRGVWHAFTFVIVVLALLLTMTMWCAHVQNRRQHAMKQAYYTLSASSEPSCAAHEGP